MMRLVQKVITANEMREIDRLTTERFGIPSLALMESAAQAAAEEIAGIWEGETEGKSVLVLCGTGNNGGDGAALARMLCQMGIHVEVVLFGQVENTKGDARTNFEIVCSLAEDGGKFVEKDEKHNLSLENLLPNSTGSLNFTECENSEKWEHFFYDESQRTFDLIVDALFGTGLTRPVTGVHLHAIKSIQESRRPLRTEARHLIVSLDIPSGLNADSANLIGEAVQADLTVTFTAPKAANVLPPASHLNGRLVVASIGSPVTLLEESPSKLFLTEPEDVRRWLVKTRYSPESFKSAHGHALVIAGSRGMTGAAALAGNAAMRSGAGLVTIATPTSALSALAARTMPEVMTTELAETDRGAVSDAAFDFVSKAIEKATVVAIGPGLTFDDDRTRRFVRKIVEQRRTPLVIDADALNALSPWPAELRGSASLPLILTPHEGEMRRLMGTQDKDALADRVEAARAFAVRNELILVLKGSRTLIASPDGAVYINPTGNPGQGTAGAGDTLTGVITGFLAQAYGALGDSADALEATIAAVFVSGMAGDIAADEIGMRSMVASDIREHLSAAIRTLDPNGEKP
jgi:NAD(P)H-hydrate epimerase